MNNPKYKYCVFDHWRESFVVFGSNTRPEKQPKKLDVNQSSLLDYRFFLPVLPVDAYPLKYSRFPIGVCAQITEQSAQKLKEENGVIDVE
jgi:hypothetical protein